MHSFIYLSSLEPSLRSTILRKVYRHVYSTLFTHDTHTLTRTMFTSQVICSENARCLRVASASMWEADEVTFMFLWLHHRGHCALGGQEMTVTLVKTTEEEILILSIGLARMSDIYINWPKIFIKWDENFGLLKYLAIWIHCTLYCLSFGMLLLSLKGTWSKVLINL